MSKIIEAGKRIIEEWWSEDNIENDSYKIGDLGAEFSVSHVLNKSKIDN